MTTPPDFGVEPRDEHNRELLAQVRPPGWANPEPRGTYDLVVIGAGTAGLVAAAGAAGLGARVALIERGLMGGDCLNYGCVPSKALLASAREAAAARAAAKRGPASEEPSVDFPGAMARMRRIRAAIASHDSAQRFTTLGVDVYFGAARFVSGERIEVEGTGLDFRAAVVATGARPKMPPVPGLDQIGALTNETVFSLTEQPASMLILGGGAIGCEMAQAFARFGTAVTLVEMEERLLLNDDEDAATVISRALEHDGVAVRVATRLDRVEPVAGGARCTLRSGETVASIEVAAVLVAVGRQPNVIGLGLDRADVRLSDEGRLVVDDRLRTTNPRIFAAGDVATESRFTHVADAHARIVVRNALFPGAWKASALAIPWCTFTDPELAAVGRVGPAVAHDGGVRAMTQPFDAVDRAVLEGETEGFARIYLGRGDRIVGATVVGPHAGELISEVTVAMAAGAGLDTIGNAIHPYPTRAEVWRKVADAHARGRLTPRVRWLIEKWLAWRRPG